MNAELEDIFGKEPRLPSPKWRSKRKTEKINKEKELEEITEEDLTFPQPEYPLVYKWKKSTRDFFMSISILFSSSDMPHKRALHFENQKDPTADICFSWMENDSVFFRGYHNINITIPKRWKTTSSWNSSEAINNSRDISRQFKNTFRNCSYKLNTQSKTQISACFMKYGGYLWRKGNF